MPSDVVAQLDELREKEGWNRSQAVTIAIRELLSKKG
ncbi:ribbon-helix-helix domain-containing protein [Anatilimnocola floriformis]